MLLVFLPNSDLLESMKMCPNMRMKLFVLIWLLQLQILFADSVTVLKYCASKRGTSISLMYGYDRSMVLSDFHTISILRKLLKHCVYYCSVFHWVSAAKFIYAVNQGTSYLVERCPAWAHACVWERERIFLTVIWILEVHWT